MSCSIELNKKHDVSPCNKDNCNRKKMQISNKKVEKIELIEDPKTDRLVGIDLGCNIFFKGLIKMGVLTCSMKKSL